MASPLPSSAAICAEIRPHAFKSKKKHAKIQEKEHKSFSSEVIIAFPIKAHKNKCIPLELKKPNRAIETNLQDKQEFNKTSTLILTFQI